MKKRSLILMLLGGLAVWLLLIQGVFALSDLLFGSGDRAMVGDDTGGVFEFRPRELYHDPTRDIQERADFPDRTTTSDRHIGPRHVTPKYGKRY